VRAAGQVFVPPECAPAEVQLAAGMQVGSIISDNPNRYAAGQVFVPPECAPAEVQLAAGMQIGCADLLYSARAIEQARRRRAAARIGDRGLPGAARVGAACSSGPCGRERCATVCWAVRVGAGAPSCLAHVLACCALPPGRATGVHS
jgi:hypothetical protein